jgi:hypothetical protein
MIESRPLSKQDAEILLAIVDQATIQGSAAEKIIALKLSLKRIVEGVDEHEQ